MARIQRPILDWSQDILEPYEQVWKLAAGDAPATPWQTLKSMVKTPRKSAPAEPTSHAKVKPWIKPVPAELASCGKGRGQVIGKKLQEMASMGVAAASHYFGDEVSWKEKPVSKKPNFLTKEEQEDHRRYEECEDWVVNHQQESVGECYTSLKQQAHQYYQEVRALLFFQPDDNADLACKVLAIADWVEEFNGMRPHPIPDIPTELETLYSGPLQARGQIPMRPMSEGPRVMDVQTRSQAM